MHAIKGLHTIVHGKLMRFTWVDVKMGWCACVAVYGQLRLSCKCRTLVALLGPCITGETLMHLEASWQINESMKTTTLAMRMTTQTQAMSSRLLIAIMHPHNRWWILSTHLS